MQAFEIAARIEKEVPDMLVHLNHISMADAEDAYLLFKKVAKNATKKAWDCKSMKDYYDRAYKNKLKRKINEKSLSK